MNKFDSITEELLDSDLICYNYINDQRDIHFQDLFIQYAHDSIPEWANNIRWYFNALNRMIDIYEKDGKFYAREPNV